MIPQFLSGRHCVYRVFDADDECLYVGTTVNLPIRMLTHVSTSTWYPQAIRVAVTLHPDKTAAHAVERHEIRTLRPRWNITGRGPRALWKMQDYIDAYWAWSNGPPTPEWQSRTPATVTIRAEFLRRWPDSAHLLTDRAVS